MKNSNKLKFLDKEEESLIKSFDSIEIKKLKKISLRRKSMLQKAALRHLAQNGNLDVKIPLSEIDQIKRRAEEEGIQYRFL